MERVKGHSLWLIPEGRVYTYLEGIVHELSKRCSSPLFIPHMTFIPELEISRKDIIYKTNELIKMIAPFSVKLTVLDYLNAYYQCLFAKAEETQELIVANLKARKIFNRKDSKWTPHLSLLYGHLTSEQKEQIISDIGGRAFNCEFQVNKIHLFSTEGGPDDWYKVKEFLIKK